MQALRRTLTHHALVCAGVLTQGHRSAGRDTTVSCTPPSSTSRHVGQPTHHPTRLPRQPPYSPNAPPNTLASRTTQFTQRTTQHTCLANHPIHPTTRLVPEANGASASTEATRIVSESNEVLETGVSWPRPAAVWKRTWHGPGLPARLGLARSSWCVVLPCAC